MASRHTAHRSVEIVANPLDRYVNEYLEKYAHKSCLTKNAYENFAQPEAIKNAASIQVVRVKGRGWKRHDHFRRHSPEKYLEATRLFLLAERELQASSTFGFDALLGKVSAILGNVDGLGILAWYDMAELLSYHWKCYPKFVYLHAGTLIGARALLPQLAKQGQKLDIGDFPFALCRLEAPQIEDFLCLNAKRINEFSTTDWVRIKRDWRGT